MYISTWWTRQLFMWRLSWSVDLITKILPGLDCVMVLCTICWRFQNIFRLKSNHNMRSHKCSYGKNILPAYIFFFSDSNLIGVKGGSPVQNNFWGVELSVLGWWCDSCGNSTFSSDFSLLWRCVLTLTENVGKYILYNRPRPNTDSPIWTTFSKLGNFSMFDVVYL